MLVKSKGNIVEIFPGIKFVERNHSVGPVFYLETISEVIIDNITISGKSHKRYNWKAINIETGEVNNICITEGLYHYGPTLFQTYEESQTYWKKYNSSLE